jgi:hypothetical protein
VADSQSLAVPLDDADATSLPSGENATARTRPEWPSSVPRAAPVAGSQAYERYHPRMLSRSFTPADLRDSCLPYKESQGRSTKLRRHSYSEAGRRAEALQLTEQVVHLLELELNVKIRPFLLRKDHWQHSN